MVSERESSMLKSKFLDKGMNVSGSALKDYCLDGPENFSGCIAYFISQPVYTLHHQIFVH